MTHTPASDPLGPATTPPMSDGPTFCAKESTGATARNAATMSLLIASSREMLRRRGCTYPPAQAITFSLILFCSAPNACQPGLLLARQAGGSVVVVELDEPCGRQVAAPGSEVMVRAVAPAVPAFLVMAARVRAEQHPARLERGAQLRQYSRQFLARNVKQRRIGENAVEARRQQVELEEVLLPHLAAAVFARHGGEARRAFEAYRGVPERRERLEVAPRPAAQVEDAERRLAFDMAQQLGDVLADVVIARAAPEVVRAPLVVLQRELGDARQLLRFQSHNGYFPGETPMPKGMQRSNREKKKPKQPKKPVTPMVPGVRAPEKKS